jgi:hypothetical protein
VSLFAGASVASINGLTNAGRSEYADSGDRIGALPVPATYDPVEITTPVTTETTAVVTTTTTVAPATTTTPGPTTTTTVAPATTTTTLPPTTTTTVPVAAGATASTPTVVTTNSKWTAQTTITVRSTTGALVPGATISAKLRLYDGSWDEDAVTLTTGANGTVVFGAGSYKRSGNGSVDKIEFVVVSVTMPAGYTWDGTGVTVTAPAP